MEAVFLLLKDYGALGLFVLYLIYDRRVYIKALVEAIDRNTKALDRLEVVVQTRKK